MTKPVQIIGVKRPEDPETKILSQNPTPPDTPRILDKTTPQFQEGVEVVAHEELITDSDEVRRALKQAGDPEVRIRHSPTAGNFDKIKRGEEDAY